MTGDLVMAFSGFSSVCTNDPARGELEWKLKLKLRPTAQPSGNATTSSKNQY
jgi:hypothetical protein